MAHQRMVLGTRSDVTARKFLFLLCLAAAACSSAGTADSTSGSSGGNSAGTGGHTGLGTGGSKASGGNNGSGGTSGTGGSKGTGGFVGTGGALGTGGSGGSNAGTGGSGTGGSAARDGGTGDRTDGAGATDGAVSDAAGSSAYAAVQAIFAKSCVRCHDPARPFVPETTTFVAMDLTAAGAYASLVNKPASAACGGVRVVPGDPTRSFLYHKVADVAPCFGSRMPAPGMALNRPTLTPAEIATISAWISGGAKP